MSVFMYLLNLLPLLYVLRYVCSSCVFENGKYDLSMLDRPSGWPVSETFRDGTVRHFDISICRPLNYSSIVHQERCPRSSVCLVSENRAVSLGKALENTSDYTIYENVDTSFTLSIRTFNHLFELFRYRVDIIFACGPHLGRPEFRWQGKCGIECSHTVFFWRTSAACTVKPKNRQVPCYVLDERGDVRNLSPLIKGNDGYFVYTPNPSVNFIINVCSDLNLDSSEINCPKNLSACKISGREYYSFGSVSEGLKYTPEGLLLTYKISDSSASPADCQLKPKTTVFFKCPARGNSQPPKLISDYNCQYEVEWETEYACPESMLKGDLKICQFTEELHGVAIDLSPLRKKVYNVTSPTTSTSFALSVCSGLGNVTCEGKYWKPTAVCAFSSSGASKIVGSTIDSELLYVDGTVSLTYLRREEACDGSQYMSVINFICDINASHDGDGEPLLAVSQKCINIFEWHTKHACLKHRLDTPCSVTYDKKTVNLQKLLLVEGEPWEAIDRASQKTNQAEYLINVCGRISRLNYSMCGEDSSACVVNAEGEYLNLGNFTSPPEYDNVSDSVRLHYTGGSKCKENETWHSTFNFICKPGQINSKPVLTRIDETLCHYEFEWQTADACPTGLIEGSDCKVLDNNLGIKYDLTPLKSKVYKIDSPLYEFYLGVCEPVKDSPCTSSNVGVCQVDKSNQTAWNTGEPTSRVSYMDGVINLTYLSGDPYYDQNRTARVTSIIFICDFNAGNGNPRFIEVEDFAFVFHWYTDLVCPHVSTECIVHDPFSHFIYDLSGLSMAKRNYMAVVYENKKSKIYFNVCRSLAMPTDCDPYAAACLVEQEENGEEKVIVSNLGRAVNPPVLKYSTRISLTYTNGDVCQSLGENQTYSTRIQFVCSDEDSLQTDYSFFHKTGACEYSFVWHTKAACLVGNLPFKNGCQLTDFESGFTFDLTSLHKIKEPYLIPSPSGGNFQFNICGKVVDGCFSLDGNMQSENISVCELDNKGALKSNLATSDNYILSYSTSTDLTLTYKSTSRGSIEVVIKFPCYNSTTTSKPKFMHYEDGQYTFEMKTPLTCIPEPVNCNFVDKYGNEYDLSHLEKYRNWEVSDIRPGYSHIKYHINFCRPLIKVDSYRCPGGASSACQTNLNTPEVIGYDLGSKMNVQTIDSNRVVIEYSDGSPCFVNERQRRTVIRLFCSSYESEMRFLTETSNCEFIFSLHTPSACPPETSQGKNCRVRDPLFGYTFNLNLLKNKHSNYNVSVGEYTYALNVCDKLNNFNNRCINSSGCQLKPSNPDFSESLGLPSDTLIYRKGLITLEYKSGSGNCKYLRSYNRSTKITFTCHHEDRDELVFRDEAGDCTNYFEWATRHACPPFDVTECSVVDDKGLHYDLSRLSLPNDNYYVYHPTLFQEFVINVCRSVVRTPRSLCPYTSAACIINSDKTEPLNLGKPYLKPYFNNNGKIEIKYTAGGRCDEEAAFLQTVIEFTCDPSLIDSKPKFIRRDVCTYYFGWRTAYACPPTPVESRDDCTVKDPITGHVFNFSSLKDHGFFNVKHGDHQYSLRICASKNSSPCGDSAGMCQEELSGDKHHWMGGKVNNNLMYNNGILLLNYSDGEQCHKEQFKRNTLIEFRCGYGVNEPQFLYESHDCTYHFIWKTELACQTLTHCSVKNGSFLFDFAALAESHHHAATSILNDTADYYIKLCSSLDGDPFVKCPPGATVCRRSLDSNGSYVTESLGKGEYQPFVDFLGHPTIIYTNGSTCKKNTDHQNHARIIFLCEADAGMGQPVLVNYDDQCYFLFEWRTSIVCTKKTEVLSSFISCIYAENSRGIYFDLNPLQKTGTRPFYEASLGGKHMSFILNVCAPLHGSNVTKCSDAGVCGIDGNVVYNYGKAISQTITNDGYHGYLKLMFYDGDDCPTGINGKRASRIDFDCDPTAGLGYPVKAPIMFVDHGDCLAIFWWKTALVCSNVQRQCSFDVDGHHYDFNLLSRLSQNWITSDTKNNTYWINICRGVETTVDSLGCWPTSAVCVQDKNGNYSSLGMVPTDMQIKSEKNSTDLILTFENGDAAVCSSINSTTPLNVTTRLFMRCGRSLGRPRIISGPDSQCYYDFVWETSLACANITEEVLIEKDGIFKNSRLGLSFDINDILNRTFIVPGNTTRNQYMYKINLSGGVAQNVSDPRSPCAEAAICQTKPDGNFGIDIGSFQTRTFMVKGAELYLVFKSLTRYCGGNATKLVTTLINMQCSSAAGLGSPEFEYESGNCDYIFNWPTAVVCPGYHRKNHNSSTDFVPNPFKDTSESHHNSSTDFVPNPFNDTSESHHTAETVVGIILAILAVIIIAFIFVKSEKRAIISFRLRNSFGRVSLPYFRYRRDEIITESQSEL